MGRELGVLQGAEDADGVSSGLSLGRERAEKSAGKAVGGGVQNLPQGVFSSGSLKAQGSEKSIHKPPNLPKEN